MNDLNCLNYLIEPSWSSRLGCNPGVVVQIFEAPQQPNHNRLLHMEPVLSLIEGDALGSFQHFVGYLLTAMGWETVHDHCILLRHCHDSLIHLIAAKGFDSLCGLFLLPVLAQTSV